MLERPMDDIFDAAGLSNDEAGTIMGVSRVMMWKYRTGRSAPRKTHKCEPDKAVRYEVMTHVLAALVKKGQLPRHQNGVGRFADPEVKSKREKMILQIKELVDKRVEQVRFTVA